MQLKASSLFFLLLVPVLVLKAQPPKLVLPLGNSPTVEEAVLSPDHQYVLSRNYEIARLWDAKKGHLLATLYGHNEITSSIGFSPDGSMFFTASKEEGTIIIWRTKTASQIFKLKVEKEKFHSFDFNLQGTLFATGSFDKKIRIWNLQNGELIRVIEDKIQHAGGNELLFNRTGNIIRSSWDYSDRNYWDVKTGKLLARTTNHSVSNYKVIKLNTADSFFLNDESDEWNNYHQKINDDRYLYYGNTKDEILITDYEKKKIFTKLTGHIDLTAYMYLSEDGSSLYTEPDEKNYYNVWDVNTTKLKKTVPVVVHRSNVLKGGDTWKLVISNNDKTLFLNMRDERFAVFSLIKSKELSQFNEKILPQKLRNAFFSDNSAYLATLIYNDSSPAWIWNVATGEVMQKLNFPKEEGVSHACFSYDNSLIALYGNYGLVRIYNLKSGELLKSVKTTAGGIGDLIIRGQISRDNNMFFIIDEKLKFKIYNIQSGKEIYSISEPGNLAVTAVFSADSRSIYVATVSGNIKKINLDTKKSNVHFLAVDSTNYFSQIASGYYQGDPAAIKLLHYVTKDLKVISFEQLDVKYNRPDKVLEAIGNTDTAMIKSYRKAYEKRIRKLGIDTTAFRDGYSVPEADFTNRDGITYEQKNRVLSLRIKGIDSTHQLDRFNVWVNETPIFGQRGINIRRKKSNNLDTTIAIKLSQGENRIETSITNVNGTESYRMPLYVNYTPAVKQKESLKFIGIGIEKFADANYNLNYSVKDIRNLSTNLKQKYGDNITIDTLFNENVTTSNVKALKQKLLQTTENDKVIIAYSGHGMLSKDYDYYLSTYSVNFEKPEQNGLPYDELENLLDSIPARKKLMLIDACHSGEVDKEDLVMLNATPDSLIKGLKPVGYKQEGNIGLKNSFELMQSLFVNVGKSTGATIISAAAGTQFALERNDLKNGVFTYSILEAMKNYPTMKISELKKIVGERVEQLTKGLQKPTSRNETIAVDWNIW